MRKILCLMLGVIIFALCGCGKTEDNDVEGKWDCSVINALEDETTINYSDVEIRTNSDKLYFQNRNEFIIHLYLYSNHPDESFITERDIQPGGQFVFCQVSSDDTYTIGVHANIEEGESIHIMVYDADTQQEPYEIKP